jgi:cytochrome c1
VGLALLACAAPTNNLDSETPKTPVMAKEPGSNFDASGFPEGDGRDLVAANCTACHSDKLVRQNRSNAEGWRELILWMQKKQGLWPLDPKTEDIIVGYLATNYGRPAVADDTRRPALPDDLMPPTSLPASAPASARAPKEKTR